MVRWDSPLISIPWDEDPPFEEIWNVVIKGEKKGPTAAVMQVSPVSLDLAPIYRNTLKRPSCERNADLISEQSQHRTPYIL